MNSNLEISASQAQLAGDPARQAVASIRGTIYQIWWSIDLWLRVKSPDEVIYLEGAEDLDRVGPGVATAGQVKNESERISLNYQRSHEALENYWALSLRESNRRVDFHYISTTSAALERDATFGGIKGLEAWCVAQTSVEMAGCIQAYLSSKLVKPGLLKEFLRSASAQEVQDRLIRRVHWFLDQPGLSDVQRSVRERVTHRLSEDGIPTSYVDAVLNQLYAFASEVLLRQDSAMRRLSHLDLHEQISAATTTKVAIPALQFQKVQRALQSGAFDPEQALLHATRLGLPKIPAPLLNRVTLVEQVRRQIEVRQTVLLTGTIYKGKSTIAQLVASAVCPDAWWFKLSTPTGAETDKLFRALATVISDETIPALVVVDDLDISPSAHDFYGQSLSLLVSRAARAGRGLLLTARGESTATAQLSDFVGIEVIDVPEMTAEEIQQHCIDNACPTELACTWGALIRSTTLGHPRLVHVRIGELVKQGWPNPTSVDVLSPSEGVVSARHRARRMLSQTVTHEVAAFVYTAAEVTFPLTRQMLLGLAQKCGGIPNAGDVIDELQGTWLELVPVDRLRVTPVLNGSASQVWTPERQQLAHSHIYDAIAGVKSIGTADAASLLFHAYLAKDGPRLVHCAHALETIGQESVSAAVFEHLVWLPYVALSEGQHFFEPAPSVSAMLRHLQFSVANQLDCDTLPAVIARWTEEIDCVEPGNLRTSLEVMRCSKLLSNRNPRVPLREKLAAICLLERQTGEAARISHEYSRRFVQDSLGTVEGLPECPTNLQMVLSLHASSVRTLDDLEQVLIWLEQDCQDSDRIAFETILHWPLVDSCGAFVHGAWSSRHSTETEWAPTVEVLSRADAVARRFGLVQFGSEVARAKSIVLSEHIKDHAGAMRALDEAAAAFGETVTISEQRVNALFQADDDLGALMVWEALVKTQGAATGLDAFAYRRAGISACRVGRWQQAQSIFLAGSALEPIRGLATTRYGLVVDASHAAALGGAPKLGARMLAELLMDIPAKAWEDGHTDWESLLRVVNSVCNVISSVVAGDDPSVHNLAFGKASEPGLNFGPSQPNQVLRTQLAITQVGFLASRLGDIPDSYRGLLEKQLSSDFPLVRLDAAKALLAFEYNAGTGQSFALVLSQFERAFNTIASLPDRQLAMQSDGGDTPAKNSAVDIAGWVAVFAAAAICCDTPASAVQSWHSDAVNVWGEDSPVAKALSDISRGLALAGHTALDVLKRRLQRPVGEYVGAALSALRSCRLSPIETFQLQVLLASSTVCYEEGLSLQPTFGKALARRFAGAWETFAQSPFLLRSPRTFVPALNATISKVQEGKASISELLEVAAGAVGSAVGEVAGRLE